MAEYSGTVQIGTSAIPLEVSGSPLGRTVVRSGSQTLFDKSPIILKDSYEFDAAGKVAKLRWVKVQQQFQCQIVVDGKSTFLARQNVNAAGSPMTHYERVEAKRREARNAGYAMIAAAAACSLINYYTITHDHEYYPKMAAIIPVGLIGGLFMVVKQPTTERAITRNERALIVVVCALLGVGWYFFSDWLAGRLVQ